MESVAVGSRAGESADYRVFDTGAERWVDFATIAPVIAGSDVILFGEFHDDPITHVAQLELFRRVVRERAGGVLGMEMFERDVQPVLEGYTRGEITEEEFLASARPWSNYRIAYRPLVASARRDGWDVLATNLPQELATRIAREGLEGLEREPAQSRMRAAAELICPEDEYWLRFLDAMDVEADSAMQAAHSAEGAMMWRMYEAQCARDETMAEAIVPHLGRALVFHLNGAFHSDYRLGIVPRLLRRAPDASIVVISAIPVADLRSPPVEEHLDRADYIVFTREPVSSDGGEANDGLDAPP